MIDFDIEIPSKKVKCKQLILEIFGPKCAARVDEMSEAECVQRCRGKVQSLLGHEAARRFDYLK